MRVMLCCSSSCSIECFQAVLPITSMYLYAHYDTNGFIFQVGYYMVMEKQKEKFPKVVFCDLTKLPGEPGFQRTFGSPGNLRHFVAFDATLE